MTPADMLAQYYADRNLITLLMAGYSLLCCLGVLAASHSPERIRRFLLPGTLVIILLQFILSIVLGGGSA